MEHYLSRTNYPIWQVIQNGNGPIFVTTDTNGMIKVLPPKTAEEVMAREREIKARTTLLMALPEDHLAKFHKMQQFEGFSVSALEGLHKGNQDSRRRDFGYNGNKARDNGRRPAYHDDSKALVTVDGEDIDWSGHVEEDAQNYDMMAYSSSNSGSDNEMSDNDKFGLGYGDYGYGSILSYENEVLQSVFINKENNLENTSVNDRYAKGMHAVPPPMTGTYMPSRPDVEIDYSKFTYGPKQTLVD
nr:hypothetical protein [Tanacetum cinerariifolium]